MKLEKFNNYWVIGLGLVGLSIVLHYVHYIVFHDLHHTLIFFSGRYSLYSIGSVLCNPCFG